MTGTITYVRKLVGTELVEVPEYRLDGRVVPKRQFDRATRPRRTKGGPQRPQIKRGWPMLSEALAVHPSQVAEAREDAARKGVPTDFAPDGRVIFRTRKHRAEYLRRYGYFDRDAGYGDPSRGSFRG